MDSKRSSFAWRLTLVGLGLEILIALIAIWMKATGNCASCGAPSLADISIGVAGVAFYAALLGIAFWIGPALLLFIGIFAGFAVHVALLIGMLSSGTLCPPCALAAGVSAMLIVAALVYDAANFRRAAIVLPLVAVAIQIGAFIARHHRANMLAEVHAEVSGHAATEGRVRLVIIEEPDCPYCQVLECDVLPEIEREFGAKIDVIRRRGRDFPGIALPTVIVVGAEEEVFEGLPTRDLLRGAIVRALAGAEPKTQMR